MLYELWLIWSNDVLGVNNRLAEAAYGSIRSGAEKIGNNSDAQKNRRNKLKHVPQHPFKSSHLILGGTTPPSTAPLCMRS